MNTKLKKIVNPLIEDRNEITFDIDKIKSPLSLSTKNNPKKVFKKLFRKENAKEAIKGLQKDTDIFGFTRGQFSLVELIEAVVEITGPCDLFMSTWTAATADLRDVLSFLKSGKILSARFLIDFSFQRRQPAVAKAIRDQFGFDSLRITRNHAKFFQVSNKHGWNLTCKTSMNLNTNMRFEDFDISNDKVLFDFLKTITDEVFKKSNSKKQEAASSSELWFEFKNG